MLIYLNIFHGRSTGSVSEESDTEKNEISGSHGGEHKEGYLLACCAV
jgi:hypothetical protein